MFKAYIVEDEVKAIELLQIYIQRIDFLDLVGVTRNPLKAFSYLQENQIDVLFLDINMPILSGIELLKSISQAPNVIFTTAYPEYAVEGFDLEAVDYLLKPISFPRFLKACERLRKQQKINTSGLEPADPFLSDIVYVKSGPTTHKLSWKEVLYLEKAENYVIYHTKNQRILSRQTLSNLETIFPSYICRIHKSYAVSLLHLTRIERESVLVKATILPVGRTFRNRLMEKIDMLGNF